MVITKLSEIDFHRYFQPPMRKISLSERSDKIDLTDCIKVVLKLAKIYKPIEQIHIPHIYIDVTNSYEHILLSYGMKNIYLVLVTNKEKVIGYHVLDLNEKYSGT